MTAVATERKERPILMDGESVRALLEGYKTQTRRIVKNPEKYTSIRNCAFCCPYGAVGDVLWVRETWYDDCALDSGLEAEARREFLYYRADGEAHEQFEETYQFRWRPSIFMPRWASRISLTITGIEVQCLREISNDDAIEEGILGDSANARDGFMERWDSIHGEGAWMLNPWVWALTFTVDVR